ncbi:hypothetical protein NN561_010694 [Cricetulus griseus]
MKCKQTLHRYLYKTLEETESYRDQKGARRLRGAQSGAHGGRGLQAAERGEARAPRFAALAGRRPGPTASSLAAASVPLHPKAPRAPSLRPDRSLPRPLNPISSTLLPKPACLYPDPPKRDLAQPSPAQQLLLLRLSSLASWCSAGGPPRSQCALRAGRRRCSASPRPQAAAAAATAVRSVSTPTSPPTGP